MILLLFDLFVVSVIFVLTCLGLYQKYSKFFKLLKKIPGPPQLPLIGDSFTLIANRSTLFANDRHRALLYYPIYSQYIAYVGAVNIYHPEDIEIVLSSMKHIKKSRIYDLLMPWLGTGLLTSTDAKWQTRRKILTPSFHFTILQEFLNIFNSETETLVKALEKHSNEEVNTIPFISNFTLKSMAETSMGIKLDLDLKTNRDYKKLITSFTDIVTYRMVRPWFYENKLYLNTWLGKSCLRIAQGLHEFTGNIVKTRQESLEQNSYAQRKRQAMLDLLLTAKKNGELIDDEGIREEVDTFMFEGHDTTAVALCFILMTLANEQKYQEEIYQEIIHVIGDLKTPPTFQNLTELSFTERCLKECLRLYPSVAFIGRDAREDITLATGYTIPNGAMVHVHIYDVHRNPNLFPHPEKFDPDRFLPENMKTRHPFAYIPFSAGPRNCIGQKFAMLELKAALCGILRRFRLDPVDAHKDLHFLTDIVLRTKNAIRVKFVPREDIK